MIKEITKEDLLRNRFIVFTNSEKTKFKVKYPTRSQAEKFHKKTLCIFVGVYTLRKRDINGALSNANFFLNRKTKEEILDQFFPKKIDISLNSIF